ncbi:MAG: hypothetical protein DI555_21965 [Novosphingobium pentaromativorans]|uniref:Uncharacterized protein n=1 Tax=Novosphingobium pentaromativorans TaxID=205844 RepID=A0A2W5NER8_9SPHN|nr:MAG: hypothetical protein DI555_21965 [Novosphingobium pentaromativorans]
MVPAAIARIAVPIIQVFIFIPLRGAQANVRPARPTLSTFTGRARQRGLRLCDILWILQV